MDSFVGPRILVVPLCVHFAVPPATAGRWMTLGALLQDHLEIWIPTLAEGRAVIWRYAASGKTIITWP
ncbi:hypothetical protein [Gordonia sp. NPDC003585]|uniref:hypothetical protein n=1 Tax=Gordonia sp. NPDC003585 TaxID=3154275 RepID=UPI0033A04E23